MVKDFGTLNDVNYHLYFIENEFLKVAISDFGATLVSLVDKQSNQNCVLGFDNVNDYYQNIDQAKGACVGRNANRIAKGSFELDGVAYKCFINNGPNSLHGGQYGFMKQKFKVLKHDETSITLSYFSKDLEEGFPGNLTTTIVYHLKDNSLYFNIIGIADKKTIFNITNHSYFNLGDSNILNHRLMIPTNQVALVDQDGLTLDEVIEVGGTSFDFGKEAIIKEKLNLAHPNIALAKGYDHNYLFEDTKDKLRAILSFKDLTLKVESDLPGLHVYSGNYLDVAHEGIALECQYYPNAINYQKYQKPIIEKDTLVNHYIKFTIERN